MDAFLAKHLEAWVERNAIPGTSEDLLSAMREAFHAADGHERSFYERNGWRRLFEDIDLTRYPNLAAEYSGLL